MIYISPLTGKEVSKATYYRHWKKCGNGPIPVFPWVKYGQTEDEWIANHEKADRIRSQFQSQSQIKQFKTVDLADEWSKEVARTSGRKIAQKINGAIKSQSQSQSPGLLSVNRNIVSGSGIEYELAKDIYNEKMIEFKQVFRNLFLVASSRGIPKKIVQECEKFL